MSGINEWGGPSRCSDAMARAIGFESVENLFDQGPRLREHLKFGEPMSTASGGAVQPNALRQRWLRAETSSTNRSGRSDESSRTSVSSAAWAKASGRRSAKCKTRVTS